MRPDVTELRSFYATRLGAVACRILRGHIRELCPDAHSSTVQQVLGLGYATPYLLPFLEKPESRAVNRIGALMPAGQGVVHWPPSPLSEKTGNLTLLADESALPVRDESIDKFLAIHALEYAENPAALLAESWRALAPGGRALFIVPHRAGLWARADNTPFGSGHPYTIAQLESLLKEAGFLPVQSRHALFVPPTLSRFWLNFAKLIEKLCCRLLLPMGGTLIVFAEKRVYAPIKGNPAPVTKSRKVTAPVATTTGFRKL